jgi:phage gpG-like protein
MEALEELERKLKSPRARHLIGQMAVDDIRTRLVKGEGFAPLSGATKEYRGGTAKPLQDTSHLRESFSYRLDGESGVVVGSDNRVAAVQNDGKTIRAKKSWLFIPASAFTRQLMRRYGYSPKEILAGLKGDGYSVFRAGRAVGYRAKRKVNGEYKITWIYWLKKEVVIPARRFFYLDDNDIRTMFAELELL